MNIENDLREVETSFAFNIINLYHQMPIEETSYKSRIESDEFQLKRLNVCGYCFYTTSLGLSFSLERDTPISVPHPSIERPTPPPPILWTSNETKMYMYSFRQVVLDLYIVSVSEHV